MCDEKLNELLLLYPGIRAKRLSSDVIILRGIIRIKDSWFNIHIKCPNFPHLKNSKVQVQNLYVMETITEGIQSNWTIFELITQLPNLLNGSGVLQPKIYAPIEASKQQNIYSEIVSLFAPDQYVIKVNEPYTKVHFSKFTQFEHHYLEVNTLPTMHIHSHSLPDCLQWDELLLKGANMLTTVVQRFLKYFEDLQPFYDNFIDIDELCHVVQPELPTTKSNWRLFVLRERVFLKLTIADPFAPIASMSINIIGPTYEVEKLRRIYSEGLCAWDTELDIHKNLLRIFDLCFFPMPPDNTKKLNDEENCCSICYCYKLDQGEVPIISCDNPQCSLIFHAVCLRDWFNSLSDGKVFLDVSFGECPLCKAKLSPSFAHLMEI